MWNILVADDEGIERMLVKKVLSDYYQDQFTIYTSINGREAIEAAEQQPIHIAIMDINMPGINGIEAAKEIKKKHPECSILFLTAYSDFSYAREALTVKAIDYLLKPCPDEELINAVDAALQAYKNMTIFQNALQASQMTSNQMPADSATEPVNNSAVTSRIIQYIRANYHNDLSLQDMAEEMNYSEVYFCKLFKSIFNVNFTTYITGLRIEEAKELLADPQINIKDIASRVGYPDPNYFAKVFKRREQISPSEYRMQFTEL